MFRQEARNWLVAIQGGTRKPAKAGVEEEGLRLSPKRSLQKSPAPSRGRWRCGRDMSQSVSFLGFPDWGSVHSLSVVETNYEEYALLFSRGTKGPGQDFRMATLYSRYPSPLAQNRGDD